MSEQIVKNGNSCIGCVGLDGFPGRCGNCGNMVKNCKDEPSEGCKGCFAKSTCPRVAEFIYEEGKEGE